MWLFFSVYSFIRSCGPYIPLRLMEHGKSKQLSMLFVHTLLSQTNWWMWSNRSARSTKFGLDAQQRKLWAFDCTVLRYKPRSVRPSTIDPLEHSSPTQWMLGRPIVLFSANNTIWQPSHHCRLCKICHSRWVFVYRIVTDLCWTSHCIIFSISILMRLLTTWAVFFLVLVLIFP